MIGRKCDNGRDGGGKAGPENRYSHPAVDTDQFEDAKTGAVTKAPKQGEVGQVIGAYANTMSAPRGKIMGTTVNVSWPERGFSA